MRLSTIALSAAAFAFATQGAMAQSYEEAVNDAATPENVITYGSGYGLQRHSTLTDINKETVGSLSPAWVYSLADNRGQETHPLIYDGVMYVTVHNATAALDAKTGREIWRTPHEYSAEVPRIACCGIVNRGSAIRDGMLFRTLLDAHVIALDMKTGEEVWRSHAIEFRDGYSLTVAPLVTENTVITGISGAEYGIRGFIDGWDIKTGEHKWRTYTTAAPDEPGGDTWPGETYIHGGGSAWLTGSYDPELKTVYWGTGNAGPWNSEVRKGDNLYTTAALALDPDTGEIKWYYQFSPRDPYDYDGVNSLIHADLEVDGQMRKVIMQANRNAFFYVIDRESGELIAANEFAEQNWSDGIDMATGRPMDSDLTKSIRAGNKENIWPSLLGGKNWAPMSYSPTTGLAYANTLNFGMNYQLVEPKYRAGTFYFGADFAWDYRDENRGALSAIDPLTGETKWASSVEIPRFAGTLVTDGGVVFTGAQTGEFEAFDADTGDKLYEFNTGSGIVGQPVTWTQDGEQYVAIANGSGAVYALFSGDERLAQVPAGGNIWVFKLNK